MYRVPWDWEVNSPLNYFEQVSYISMFCIDMIVCDVAGDTNMLLTH